MQGAFAGSTLPLEENPCIDIQSYSVCSSLPLHPHFLRSLSEGRVRVEATALSQGRTQQLWRVDITDESGRLVAHGELRLQNVAGR